MDWLAEHWRWDWPVVAALLAIAGRAAWLDFRTGKIPNRLLSWLMLGISLWLCVLVFVVTSFPEQIALIHPLTTLPDYLLTIALNGGLAFLIGVALWIGGLWAAGDSKLFPLLCLALPLHYYTNQYVSLWPGFVLFYNIVMVSLVVILVDLALRLVRAVRSRLRGEAPVDETRAPWHRRAGAAVRDNAKSWGGLLLMFVAIFIFIKALRSVLGDAIELVVHLDQTVLYVVLFFLCHPLMRLVSKTWVLVLVASVDIVLFIVALGGWVEGLTVASLILMSAVSLGVIVFRLLYDAYQQRMDFIEMDVEDLRPRMVLAEALRDRIKDDTAYFEAQEEDLGPLLPDGLHEEQVPLVQRWLRERAPGRPVPVQKTLPMAPSILIGLIITVILQDYVIQLGR